MNKQLLDQLEHTKKALAFQIEEKAKRAGELVIANVELAFQNEEKGKRASELIIANIELAFQQEEKRKRAAELAIANIELMYQNEEKEKRSVEIAIANKELVFQGKEKERNEAALMVANYELVFQNDEKEKRAAELNIANKELVFQNSEKEKRAAELVIANKELIFQNNEKEKRAAELVIANEELIFQNNEKEKRAAELVVANTELIFQNGEKEKRAAELVIANKELVFQNSEKEKRAAELFIANKELTFQNAEKGKRAEEVVLSNLELETVNKELESFSYSVSHDLRSPVRKIAAFATMLEQKYKDKFDAQGTEILRAIIRSSKTMNGLIDDLLSFSKLGTKAVVVSEIDMERLVASLVKESAEEDSENKIQFDLKALPVASGDESLIKQVWINLISNAIKYSKFKPAIEIEIGSYVKDDQVVFYIKDNGIGFDMKCYERLFGVFERFHAQKDFEGTGIGLAIVKKIVTRHNGTVWAESKPDQGATFYFSLPLCKR